MTHHSSKQSVALKVSILLQHISINIIGWLRPAINDDVFKAPSSKYLKGEYLPERNFPWFNLRWWKFAQKVRSFKNFPGISLPLPAEN